MLELQSDLWLDQPDAHDRIEERLARGCISADEAAGLHLFADDGYVKFALDLDPTFCDGFDDEVTRLWDERPADLAVSPAGSERPDGASRLRRPVPGSRVPHPRPAQSFGARARSLPAPQDLSHGRAHLRRARDLVPVAVLRIRIAAGAASRSDVRRDRSAVASAWRRGSRSKTSRPRAVRSRTCRSRTALPWFEFEEGSVVCGAEGRPRTSAPSSRRRRGRRCATAGWRSCRSRAARGDVFIWHAGLDPRRQPDRRPHRGRGRAS